MTGAACPAEKFEPHRTHLFGLAYRMLGSVSEAEDVVQDAYLHWQNVDVNSIDNPRAWLGRVATRLCLDRLKSARARREVYIGPWLPEPVVNDAASTGELAHDLSVALLLTLERLSPLERAAFLLHDVFDIPFPEIALRLDRSEAACRQLASRARQRIRESDHGHRATPQQEQRLKTAFVSAVTSGDLEGLSRLLVQDAVCITDGGGKANAALHPIGGADRVSRLLIGLARKFTLPPGITVTAATLNGLPGYVILLADGTPLQTVALEMNGDSICAIYIVRNPDKLGHLARPTTRH